MFWSVIRKYLGIVVVAVVAATVAGGGIGIAHDEDGGGHDQLAHRAVLSGSAIQAQRVVQIRQTGTAGATSFGGANADCPPGWLAIAGGVSGSSAIEVRQSYPSDGTDKAGRTSWRGFVFNSFGSDLDFFVYVSCVKARNLSTNFENGDDSAPPIAP